MRRLPAIRIGIAMMLGHFARLLILTVVVLAPPAVAGAQADTTPARPPAAQPTGNGTAAPATTVPPAADPNAPCKWSTAQTALPTQDAHAALAILPSTRWQPLNGDVQFELTGMAEPLAQVSVYFAWPDAEHGDGLYCQPSLRVRLLPKADDDDGQTYRYAARVPALSDGAYFRIAGSNHWRLASGTVPVADMFVDGVIASAAHPVMFTANVGITTPWVAALATAIGLLVAWGLLLRWATKRGIPGGAFLSVIATPYGVASLSQFQILIWTFVIGGGVAYVMMLSGNLIDIPASTLGLLGVTGFALVGSKLQANADGSPQRVNAPGAVTNLAVVGTPTPDTVVLTWLPPAAADQPFSYTLQKQVDGANAWDTVANDVAGPPYAVIGLQPGVAYQFQVFAINAAGAGPAAVPLSVSTAPAPTSAATTAASAAPAGGRVSNLTAKPDASGTVTLKWLPPAPPPQRYTVQYRKARSLPWATYSTDRSDNAIVVPKLDPGTQYEFQVFGVFNNRPGAPSDLATATTATRRPRWSDLVMSGDPNTEIDLSRLQMLVFTTITAVFTGLTLINTGVIPDLPVGELALVGISNGVYLASKVSVGRAAR